MDTLVQFGGFLSSHLSIEEYSKRFPSLGKYCKLKVINNHCNKEYCPNICYVECRHHQPLLSVILGLSLGKSLAR